MQAEEEARRGPIIKHRRNSAANLRLTKTARAPSWLYEIRLSGRARNSGAGKILAMSVPFDTLGPGQVGRAVYQVMGTDGPISNPSRIRFLPLSEAPADAEALSSPLHSAVALGGMNLLASMGAVSLGAETLRQVHALHRKVDALGLILSSVESKVDAVLSKVARIDARVAEGNLRNALEHLSRRAISPTEIDIHELGRIEADLASMFESIDGWAIGGAPGLRLSTDNADRLGAVCSLLTSLRSLVYAEYNRLVDCDPGRVLAFDLRKDYFVGLAAPKMVVGCAKISVLLQESREALKIDIDKRFSFSGSDDIQHYHELFDETVFDRVLNVLDDVDGPAILLAIELQDRLSDLDDDDAAKVIEQYREAWLWKTDAGLLWRTYVECLMVKEGYFSSEELARLNGRKLPKSMTLLCRVDADALSECGTRATAAAIAEPGKAPVPAKGRFASLKGRG